MAVKIYIGFPLYEEMMDLRVPRMIISKGLGKGAREYFSLNKTIVQQQASWDGGGGPLGAVLLFSDPQH